MDSMGTDRERVDQWLDDTLALYSKSEPRPGLEMRVLANLGAEKARLAVERRWWWAAGLVAATSVCVVAAILWLGQTGRAARSSETLTAAHHESGGLALESLPPVTKHEVKKGQRRPIHRSTLFLPAQRAVAPRLEQFPAPLPLTEQEQLLARYVQDFPRKASLVALAQTELHKQDEREMGAPWPSKTNSPDFE